MTVQDVLNLQEEFKDIPTTNKLYHQTNAINLFKILETGYLGSRQFRFGSENLKDLYQEKTSPKEIATARKSTYSTMDNIKGENKKDLMSSLSANIGHARFELYKDRLKSSKYVRGLKIKPIAEFAISEKNDVKKILEKNNIPNKDIQEILKNINARSWFKKNVLKMVEDYPSLKKLNEKDFNLFFEALKTYSHYRYNKENEERLVFSGKNETKYKDDFLNDKNDRIYLNPELMKIEILPGFVKEFLNKVAPASFLKYHNKMKSWNELFKPTPEYNKLLSLLKKFGQGKLEMEELFKEGLDKDEVRKYEKEYKKPYLPGKEKIDVEKKQYTRTGGKRVGRVIKPKYSEEQMKKDIEETKRKVLGKVLDKKN